MATRIGEDHKPLVTLLQHELGSYQNAVQLVNASYQEWQTNYVDAETLQKRIDHSLSEVQNQQSTQVSIEDLEQARECMLQGYWKCRETCVKMLFVAGRLEVLYTQGMSNTYIEWEALDSEQSVGRELLPIFLRTIQEAQRKRNEQLGKLCAASEVVNSLREKTMDVLIYGISHKLALFSQIVDNKGKPLGWMQSLINIFKSTEVPLPKIRQNSQSKELVSAL